MSRKLLRKLLAALAISLQVADAAAQVAVGAGPSTAFKFLAPGQYLTTFDIYDNFASGVWGTTTYVANPWIANGNNSWNGATPQSMPSAYLTQIAATGVLGIRIIIDPAPLVLATQRRQFRQPGRSDHLGCQQCDRNHERRHRPADESRGRPACPRSERQSVAELLQQSGDDPGRYLGQPVLATVRDDGSKSRRGPRSRLRRVERLLGRAVLVAGQPRVLQRTALAGVSELECRSIRRRRASPPIDADADDLGSPAMNTRPTRPPSTRNTAAASRI